MGKLLIHLTHGIEEPTKADRAFLIAQAAIQEGHNVSMFLAGEAVKLMKDENLDSTLGFGSKLRDYYDFIVKNGGKIYLSKISCESRGVTADDLAGKEVELASPHVLVQLTFNSDRTITYG